MTVVYYVTLAAAVCSLIASCDQRQSPGADGRIRIHFRLHVLARRLPSRPSGDGDRARATGAQPLRTGAFARSVDCPAQITCSPGQSVAGERIRRLAASPDAMDIRPDVRLGRVEQAPCSSADPTAQRLHPAVFHDQRDLAPRHPARRWLSQYYHLVLLLQYLVVGFQASFVLAVIFPRLRWLYVPAGSAFHVGNWLTLERTLPRMDRALRRLHPGRDGISWLQRRVLRASDGPLTSQYVVSESAAARSRPVPRSAPSES